VDWLLACRKPEHNRCQFPALVPRTGPPDSSPSRLAWCYGDLGVSATLYSAAINVDNAAWRQHALDVARRAARRPPSLARVRDAGLCHGSAGVAHIFNRLYQATGEEVFCDAARYWIARTLEFYWPRKGIGGFQIWRGEGCAGGPWSTAPGLLEGTAGIGLALIAAMTDVEPDWDRILLIALPQTDMSRRA
jgi:hypothetical protein